MRTGRVNASDFKKAFTEAFHDLVTDEQVQEILSHYCDDDNSEFYNWTKFLHDAENGEICLVRLVISLLDLIFRHDGAMGARGEGFSQPSPKVFSEVKTKNY